MLYTLAFTKNNKPLTFQNVDTIPGKIWINIVHDTNISNPTPKPFNSEEIFNSFNVQYKKNNTDWETYNIAKEIILNPNETVSFKADTFTNDVFRAKDESTDTYSYIYYCCFATGTYGDNTNKPIIKASGNIQSLYNYSNICTEFGFYRAFMGMKTLISAPLLTASVVNKYGYFELFNNCINLKETPDLPAITLRR